MKFSILATLLLSSVWSVAGAPVTEPGTKAVGFNDDHEASGNTATFDQTSTVKPSPPAVVTRDVEAADSSEWRYKCKDPAHQVFCEDHGAYCSAKQPIWHDGGVLSCGVDGGCGCVQANWPDDDNKLVEAAASIVTRNIEAADSSEWRYKCKDPAHQTFCEDHGAYCSAKQPIWHDGGEPTCGVDGGCGCVQANWPDDDK